MACGTNAVTVSYGGHTFEARAASPAQLALTGMPQCPCGDAHKNAAAGNNAANQCACPANTYGNPAPGGTCTACPSSIATTFWVSTRSGEASSSARLGSLLRGCCLSSAAGRQALGTPAACQLHQR